VLGAFALARLWEGATLRGPQRGRLFENALYDFCARSHLSLNERAGSRSLCYANSASGLRHESDGVITGADIILHVEAKHLTGEVSKNDLLIFNQKGLDFVLTGDARLRSRPLYRLFLSGSPLAEEARRFALLWGIIVVEPNYLPLPTLHWLAGSTFPFGDGRAESADRIWREVPALVAPIQERVKRLPNCLKGIAEIVAPARVDWAICEIQEREGSLWWAALDSYDPLWLEQVYADFVLRPTERAFSAA
jgi:hypothetical protein